MKILNLWPGCTCSVFDEFLVQDSDAWPIAALTVCLSVLVALCASSFDLSGVFLCARVLVPPCARHVVRVEFWACFAARPNFGSLQGSERDFAAFGSAHYPPGSGFDRV